MGELHSMAYTTSFSATSSSLSWNLDQDHFVGVTNADMHFVMEGAGASLFSPEESDDFSTGYLEDALLEFGERSKRRRLLLLNDEDDHHTTPPKDLAIPSYWNPGCSWGLSENFSCLSQLTAINGLSGGDEGLMMSTSMSEDQEAANMITQEMKITPEDHQQTTSSDSVKTNHKSIFEEKDTCSKEKSRNYGSKRVVYPFAMVKPGGNEGDMTLNDINERILMPPTRPVRHPVGDFACRPACVSAHGPGLSGKAVVALTRIQTHGRGTITIIRTKG